MAAAAPGTPALVALLPPGPDASLYDYAPVARASEEAVFRRNEATSAGATATLADAVVVEDFEVSARGGAEVFEMLSSGPRVALAIPCRVALPLLVLHVKDVGRFFAIEVDCADADGAPLRIVVSNRQRSVRVQGAHAALPLATVPGWNVLRIDVADAVWRAFGRAYAGTTQVAVTATCRVARVFFEVRPFEDAELPAFLRTF